MAPPGAPRLEISAWRFDGRAIPWSMLDAAVSEIQVRAFAASARPIARLPGAAASLVICTAHAGGAIVAAGPALRASYKRARDVPLYVRFGLRPGAARAVLGVPVHELAGRAVQLDALWGRRAAELALALALALATGEPGRLIRAVEAALAQRLAAAPIDRARARLIQRALARLDMGARVGSLAAELGASERYLRELFRTEVGMAPKRYARIARLHRVLAGSGPWSALAAAHGYADQAHLVSEFRSLLGVTPTEYRAGELPADAGC
jgi:AraC-like DNA-binding protein